MKNGAQEEHFVKTFIRKSRQERVLYELTTPEKRHAGVDRFSHQAADLLDHAKIILAGDGLDRQPEFGRFVRKHEEVCFVISPDFCLDGQFLPFSEAVRLAAMGTEAAVIMGSSFAVVFGEAGKGGREKYLLAETP